MKNLTKILFPVLFTSILGFNSLKGRAQNFNVFNKFSSEMDSIKIPKNIIREYYEGHKEIISRELKLGSEGGNPFAVYSYAIFNDSLIGIINEYYPVGFNKNGVLEVQKDSIGNTVYPWAYELKTIPEEEYDSIYIDFYRDNLNGNEVHIKEEKSEKDKVRIQKI